MKLSNRVGHNAVVGAIELTELGDSLVPTPRVTLKLGQIANDVLNLGGTVRDEDGSELIRCQPCMFAMTKKNVEEVGEIFAVKIGGIRRTRTRHRRETISEWGRRG
jgi:hypothetical protein